MRSHFILLATIILCTSCNNNQTEFILTASKSKGLSGQTGIFYEKLKIGSIKEVKTISKDSSVFECTLFPELQLPADSKFYSLVNDLDTVLVVKLGDSEDLLKTGDIRPLITEEESILDAFGTKIVNFIEQLSGAKKQDSILLELKKLNKNLED